jgi:hypothetical protein
MAVNARFNGASVLSQDTPEGSVDNLYICDLHRVLRGIFAYLKNRCLCCLGFSCVTPHKLRTTGALSGDVTQSE